MNVENLKQRKIDICDKETFIMNLQEAINYALDGTAILFTGSGFSYGAANIDNNGFITGLALRDFLANDCGITSTQSSLSSVSDYHIEHNHGSEKLINTLCKLFTVKSISPSHKTIMSVKWKRIYTTNYDEIAEYAAAQNNFFVKPVTLSSDCSNPASQYACVHINGYIKKLNDNTLKKEFKLTDTSYDSEILRGKPWFDFMEKDFLSSKAIIIIGFSMGSDIDISRILSNPSISSKIVFVNKPDMDPVDRNVLKKYAPVYEIGVDGFSDEIILQKQHFVPSPMTTIAYESFKYEYMQAEEPDTTSLKDLTHFYCLGEKRDSLFSQDLSGTYKYIVSRKALDILMRNLFSKKVYLATSTLGNGKTIFCEMVRNTLRQTDINVYTYQKNLVDIEFEISEICKSTKRSLVIIDDYYKHLDILNSFYINGCNNIYFLLTSRQSKLATNYRKLINTLHISESDIQPLYLYSLVNDEPETLANVLINNSLLPQKLAGKSTSYIMDYFKTECQNSIANIVLDLYNSSAIRNELTTLIEIATKSDNNDIHDLCILALANSVMNLELSFSDMLSLLSIDYLRLSYTNNPIITELFNINGDSLEISSSIISKSLLYSIIPTSDIMNVLSKIVDIANTLYPHDVKYTELLKAILSHTNFEPLIKNDSNNLKYIINFYNNIRNKEFCINNPFYWEQFASVCITAKDFITAHQCISSSYAAAKRIPGFTPFQISTLEGELLLDESIYSLNIKIESGTNDSCIDTIVTAHNLFTKHYTHPENNHYHIFSCAIKYITIFDKIKSSMTKRQFSIYIEKANDLLQKIVEYQQTPESDLYPSTHKWELKIEQNLEEAKKLLKSIS